MLALSDDFHIGELCYCIGCKTLNPFEWYTDDERVKNYF